MESLQNLLALRSLTGPEIKERYKITDEHIRSDATYQKINGLIEFYNPDLLPVRFFLRNDHVVLIYSSDPEIVDTLDGKKIIDQYGEKDKNRLRSRAGKRSNLLVYPKEGFAVAIEEHEVQFIEIFQPTTLEEYKKEIYIEVGPFIR